LVSIHRRPSSSFLTSADGGSCGPKEGMPSLSHRSRRPQFMSRQVRINTRRTRTAERRAELSADHRTCAQSQLCTGHSHRSRLRQARPQQKRLRADGRVEGSVSGVLVDARREASTIELRLDGGWRERSGRVALAEDHHHNIVSNVPFALDLDPRNAMVSVRGLGGFEAS